MTLRRPGDRQSDYAGWYTINELEDVIPAASWAMWLLLVGSVRTCGATWSATPWGATP